MDPTEPRRSERSALGNNVDIGVAMGKIGGKEYVVILYTNHAA